MNGATFNKNAHGIFRIATAGYFSGIRSAEVLHAVPIYDNNSNSESFVANVKKCYFRVIVKKI